LLIEELSAAVRLSRPGSETLQKRKRLLCRAEFGARNESERR
jgi:hypothetical protein